MAGPLGTPQNDPDYLHQGAANTTSIRFYEAGAQQSNLGVGNTVNIANGTTTSLLPILSNGQFVEIRDATSANNNGLYLVVGVPPASVGDQGNLGTGANTSPTRAQIVKVGGALGSVNISAGGVDGNTVTLFGNNTTLKTTSPGNVTGSETYKSVYFDTYSKKIWLIRTGTNTGTGDLTEDGVTLQALYSFAKEEWKSDNFLIKFDFPFTAITPEQFELVKGWQFFDYAVANSSQTMTKYSLDENQGRLTRNLVRTGGWSEQYSEANTFVERQYAGIITLGTFEDDTEDLAYYQFGTDNTDTAAADDFVYNGPVNQAISTFDDVTSTSDGTTFTVSSQNQVERSAPGWRAEGYNVGGKIVVTNPDSVNYSETGGVRDAYTITSISTDDLTLTVSGTPLTDASPDGQWASAYDNRSALTLFLRGNSAPTSTTLSKSYDTSDLAAIGVTTLQNQVYRFPLTNSLDSKIDTTDPNITSTGSIANTSNIRVRYYDTTFWLAVTDDNTLSPFGVIVDAGTVSGPQLTYVSDTTAQIADSFADLDDISLYQGGTLLIHNKQANTNPGSGGYDAAYTVSSVTGAGLVTITGGQNFASRSWSGDASFTLTRTTTANYTLENIYNVIQYNLRTDANINSANTTASPMEVVVGSTADEFLTFNGDILTAGVSSTIPENPSGGGSGVALIGYQTQDQNDVVLIDNNGTSRTFPFLATARLDFSDTLSTDSDAVYSVFFNYTFRRTITATITPTSNRQATLASAEAGVINNDTGTNPVTGFVLATAGTGDNQSTSNQLSAGDYIKLSGCVNAENNGVYRIISYDNNQQLTVLKVDGDAPVTETSTANVFVDEDPIDTPDAIAVQDSIVGSQIINTNTDLSGGSRTVNFDYSGNNQGSRIKVGNSGATSGTNRDADVIVRAIGFDTAQFVEVSGTINRSTTTVIAVTSGLERNYSNPA